MVNRDRWRSGAPDVIIMGIMDRRRRFPITWCCSSAFHAHFATSALEGPEELLASASVASWV